MAGAARAYLGDDAIVDNFAGGGGASLGIKLGLGRAPDIAINHDPEAIAMHAINHPETRHFIESVWDVDPRVATAGRRVALGWFSPDCKHHSKAKGGKPREQKIRGLAWVAITWAARVRPRVIVLENVEEFRDWGPLHRRHTDACIEHVARLRKETGLGRAVSVGDSNAVDFVQRPRREERYLAIARRYTAEEMARFPRAFGALAVELEEAGFDDVLGRAFMALELGSKWAGQFFTPFALCRVSASMMLGDLDATLGGRDFITVSDPAVGAGAMLIAAAAELHDRGIPYQQVMHATAQDIDARAAHMCYVQLSLLHIPAQVVVGDTLRMEAREVWYTPAHVLGLWSARLARRDREHESLLRTVAPELAPVPPPPPGRLAEAPPTPAPQPLEPAPRAAQLSLFEVG